LASHKADKKLGCRTAVTGEHELCAHGGPMALLFVTAQTDFAKVLNMICPATHLWKIESIAG
jgi:hypothetical protein